MKCCIAAIPNSSKTRTTSHQDMFDLLHIPNLGLVSNDLGAQSMIVNGNWGTFKKILASSVYTQMIYD